MASWSPMLPIDQNAAGVRFQQAAHHLDGRRLARTVGSEKPEHLAGVDGERDAIDSQSIAKAFFQATALEQRRHRRVSSRSVKPLRYVGATRSWASEPDGREGVGGPKDAR